MHKTTLPPAPVRTVERSRTAGLVFPCGEAPAPGSARAIAPGVQWLRFPLSSASGSVNVWALQEGAGWALVDTGIHSAATEQLWRAVLASDGALGGPPTRIIGTHQHADHVGMAGWLQRECGCDLWMTRTEYMGAHLMHELRSREASAQILAFYRRAGWDDAALAAYRAPGTPGLRPPDSFHRLEDGQRLSVGGQDWQVITGSGHSPEHACLYDRSRQLLISGDQVLPIVSSNVSVWPVEPQGDPLRDWLQSIDKLRALVPDDVLVLPSHDDPFRGLHARLDQLAAKRARGLDKVRGALSGGARRAADLLEPLFGRTRFGDNFTLQLATGEALAYLHYLRTEGEVRCALDAQGVAWYRLGAPNATGAAR